MPTLSPLQSLLVNRCAFPKQVNTPYGVKTVPCGKCLYCRKSHGRTLNSLIHNEMQDATCVQFFTLTYHEYYLPRIILNSTGEEDYPYSVPENATVIRHCPDIIRGTFLSKDEKTEIYYPLSLTHESIKLKNKEYKISSKLANEYNNSSSSDIQQNHIGILYTPDLQKFFKRLRKALHTTYNKDIRYFALAEYGGKHFRPHFHILIFTKHFNATDIQTAVYQSWHFGNINYSGEPNNVNAAISYVSSYVTATANTPILLEEISKTRTFHSKFFGLGIIKNNLEFFISHPFYILNPPSNLYKVNYYLFNNDDCIFTETLPEIPSQNYIRNKQKKLIAQHSFTNSSITSEISTEPCNIKINSYIINYLFPRPFGFARQNDYLTQILLESYDNFCLDRKTYYDYILSIFQKCFKGATEIFNLSFGFYSKLWFKDTETPHCLKRNVTDELLEMYLLFYDISLLNPDIKIFQNYKSDLDALNVIQQISDDLPPEYEFTPQQWVKQLIFINDFHNRLLSTYYISKHFCTNIKAQLINTPFYNGISFNWHLYNKKRHQLEELQKKQQLFMYFSTLEQNTLYPYECFTEDLCGDPRNAEYILPLQNEYLYSQTKHKEINNQLSPIFFDDTEYITY